MSAPEHAASGQPVTTAVRFVVTVGTDHHPFDRLIGWVNDWLAGHPDLSAQFFVQSGPAATEPDCTSERFLDVAARNLEHRQTITGAIGEGTI